MSEGFLGLATLGDQSSEQMHQEVEWATMAGMLNKALAKETACQTGERQAVIDVPKSKAEGQQLSRSSTTRGTYHGGHPRDRRGTDECVQGGRQRARWSQ